jgi:hypothetical protein
MAKAGVAKKRAIRNSKNLTACTAIDLGDFKNFVNLPSLRLKFEYKIDAVHK